MLEVYLPKFCINETEYIIKIILSDFLGLEYTIILHDESFIKIKSNKSKKPLILETSFFENCKDHYLCKESLPELPLKFWHPPSIMNNIKLTSNEVPIIFGNNKVEINDNQIRIGLDIFGSSFFMLTRYEEVVINAFDSHGRFDIKQSTAVKENFYDRPIVNEYVEILWEFLKLTNHNLHRKNQKFSKTISCDIDHLFDPVIKSPIRAIRRFFARILRDKNINLAFKDVANYLFSIVNIKKFDGYFHNLIWMMKINAESGNKMNLYFIPTVTSNRFDSSINKDCMYTRKIFSLAKSMSHRVGIHPGYNTYKDEEKLQRSVNEFKDILSDFGVNHQKIISRQHYLKFDVALTALLYDKVGIHFDSSIGSSEISGFRSGICYEYNLYDLKKRKELLLRELPLITMENSILKGQSTKKILRKFKRYEDICRLFNGNYTLLWHNSSFGQSRYKKIYQEIVS